MHQQRYFGAEGVNMADRMIDWFMDNLMGWCIVIGTALFVLLVVALIYDAWAHKDDPHILLDTREWSCSKTEARTWTQPMIVGKVITQQVFTENVCVEYTRR